MMKKRYLGAVAIGGLLVISEAGTAHAVPAYAYSTLQFQNFDLSGVFNNTPNVTVNSSSVTVTDSANYPGSSPASNSAAPGTTVFTGADPLQAKSGAGTFPAENTFNQAMMGQSGTRGDALITGAINANATSDLVAEGNLALFGGSAGSNAGSSTTISATVTVTGPTPVTVELTFQALAQLIGMVGSVGDSANAQTSASYSITNTVTKQKVQICDTSNVCGTTITPDALNISDATTDPSSSFSDGGSFASYDYIASLSDGTYQITLADSVTETLQTAANVPEPMSLALLGTGLIGLAGVARRRKR